MYYYQSGDEVISKAYKDRLQPTSSPGTTKNASIIISNMQPSDGGVYTCQVHNIPDVDGQSEADIIVTVLGKLTPRVVKRNVSLSWMYSKTQVINETGDHLYL